MLHVSGPVFVVPRVVRRKSLVVLALPVLAQEGDTLAAGAWVGRAVLKNSNFFLLRIALTDSPPGTTNRQQLPTVTNRQLPTANRHQPPTANLQ